MMCRVVGEPPAGLANNGLQQWIRGSIGRNCAGNDEAVDAQPNPQAGHGKQDDGRHGADPCSIARPRPHGAVRPERKIDRAMGGEHCRRDQAAQQPEGIEQFEQSAALIEHPQVAIDAEGYSLQQIAERHAEHHARDEPACE